MKPVTLTFDEKIALLTALSHFVIEMQKIKDKEDPLMSLQASTLSVFNKMLKGVPDHYKEKYITALNKIGIDVEIGRDIPNGKYTIQ